MVKPGFEALAVAWLVGKLYAVFVRPTRVTTPGLVAVQVNGPTEDVTSVPWLNAWASTVIVWVCDKHGCWSGIPVGNTPVTVMLSIGG